MSLETISLPATSVPGEGAQQKSAAPAPRFPGKSGSAHLLADGRGALRLLDDAGRLTAQVAQVVQLGSAHLAAAHHLDGIDHWRQHGEHAFDTLAIGNFADREALIDPATGTADAHAFIGLHPRTIAFDDLDVHNYS